MWKHENESMTNISSNILVRKWIPQNDVLAHENVVLFISHGGLFGTMESLYHGVPLLLIPFFGDQFRNSYRVAASGYGKFIKHQEITKESFTSIINELTSDNSYSNEANYESAIFKDNLAHPMDEAMFWVEHVAKFKGAKHLKSHAVKLSSFQYLLLDIVLVNISLIFVGLIVLYTLIVRLFQKRKVANVLKKHK